MTTRQCPQSLHISSCNYSRTNSINTIINIITIITIWLPIFEYSLDNIATKPRLVTVDTILKVMTTNKNKPVSKDVVTAIITVYF
jgi:hypothetical protein